ncbi:T9SS type A sorting domain-containing protein [uncultured Dokdonia sp.]|uniref:T9SS type A sorting domain-containing protein n=1 Tax=uncultured Dokdonia sp. TaxID=575653 RepID=UPI0026260672|nr:T9SS type A sorting domain-containing protein [uncultured Dokdonia sp.]
MKKKILYVIIFLLICPLSYSQISFEERRAGNFSGFQAPTDFITADVDGDEDQDVIFVSLDHLIWFKNINDRIEFGLPKLIAEEPNQSQFLTVFAKDLDNDGDLDIISGGFNNIVWFENLNGLGDFSAQQIIAPDTGEHFQIIDINGDNFLDIVALQGDVVWYEHLDGNGNFGPQTYIGELGDASFSAAIQAEDIDSDGDSDVIIASGNYTGDHYIRWFENLNGQGTFGSYQVIVTTTIFMPDFLFTVDIDQDGDIDVVSSAASGVTWHENDGSESFIANFIADNGNNIDSEVYVSDINSDNRLDIVIASTDDRNVVWYENIDNQGAFGSPQIIEDGDNPDLYPNNIFVNDLDNDGDMDVMWGSTDFTLFAWNENLDGQGTFGSFRSFFPPGTNQIFADDIDGDGDTDILSGTNNLLSWFENANGDGDIEVQRIISPFFEGGRAVFASDIDGDGDKDILYANPFEDKVAWYQNIDGQGNFGLDNIITLNAEGASDVLACDLDGDGDMDVVSASSTDDKVEWYENIDGQGTFDFPQILTTDMESVRDVFVSDLDGDGDMDILAASPFDDKLAWFENTDGQGNFGPITMIFQNADFVWSVHSSDIDGDGDMDVLSVSAGDNMVAWYENTDGLGNFSNPNIITTETDFPNRVISADLDLDGDQDVISTSQGDDTIAYYENLDGQGNFGPQQIIAISEAAGRGLHVADMDGDTDIDIFVSSGRFRWYENSTVLSVPDNDNPPKESLLYPNPTTGPISIDSRMLIQEINVYNVIGQEVYHNINNEGITSINISFLQPGLYLVTMKDTNKQLWQTKVIKK